MPPGWPGCHRLRGGLSLNLLRTGRAFHASHSSPRWHLCRWLLPSRTPSVLPSSPAWGFLMTLERSEAREPKPPRTPPEARAAVPRGPCVPRAQLEGAAPAWCPGRWWTLRSWGLWGPSVFRGALRGAVAPQSPLLPLLLPGRAQPAGELHRPHGCTARHWPRAARSAVGTGPSHTGSRTDPLSV